MYRKEQLTKYRYFEDLLKTNSITHITDSLTGLVSRQYILGFAQSLISDKIPFTFVILDLDNFKFINDTYGHHAGDDVLRGVSGELAVFIEDFGIAGRFGGDEILFIDFKHLTYDDKKAFFNDLYTDSPVLRRNFELEDSSPFVTGTIGCATYPDDATDFNKLFAMIDKTLYRGKSKGRNCYIIYVEEKHKNIEIRRLAGHGISTVMQSIVRQFELIPGMENKFHTVLPLLMDEVGITDLYYTDKNHIMHAILDKSFHEDVPDIERITKDDIYRTNDIEDMKTLSPVFCEILEKHKMETVLISKIGVGEDTDGYLICAEPRSHRIWQEDECALMYFLAKLTAMCIRLENDALPE